MALYNSLLCLKGKKKLKKKLPLSGKRRDITINPDDIKRIISGYFEQLYTHRFDNVDKTD